MHLHVADLERTRKFYCQVLGFDLTAHYGNSALFDGEMTAILDRLGNAGSLPKNKRTAGLSATPQGFVCYGRFDPNR
ncbi:VOC family protein [Paenibacillus naphthalenovorans]|uniref:VOC family protein n=1 Tax=Paenibacillus naphthalenovorans TaxID=162209 RepID=UPI0009E89D80|nr:VOC family protein [Paenibacillus naphthalenovorans]